MKPSLVARCRTSKSLQSTERLVQSSFSGCVRGRWGARGEQQKARSSLGGFKFRASCSRSQQETAAVPKSDKLPSPSVEIRYARALLTRYAILTCQIHASIPALNASCSHRRSQRSDIICAARVEIVLPRVCSRTRVLGSGERFIWAAPMQPPPEGPRHGERNNTARGRGGIRIVILRT